MKVLHFAGYAVLAAGLVLGGTNQDAMAQDGRLTIELNKLEASEEGACRALFLFRNQSAYALSGFEMSLAVVDTEGVIDRLLTLDAAPIPVARTTLKLFEIPDTQCEAIGEMIMHDITTCTPQNEETIDCFGIVDLESRSSATLTK